MAIDFTPLDGEKSRMRHAYDLVASKQHGDEITLMELAEVLDLDHMNEEHVKILWQTMDDARAKLERDKHPNTVRTVPKFGWIVPTEAEKLDLAQERLAKVRRAGNRVGRIHDATDRSALGQFDKQRLDAFGRIAAAVGEVTSRKRLAPAELQAEAAPRPTIPQRKAS